MLTYHYKNLQAKSKDCETLWWKLSYPVLYYSFLKGSWEVIKNCFKPMGKYDAKKGRLTAPVNLSNSTDAKNEVTPVKRMKRNHFWNEIPIQSDIIAKSGSHCYRCH